MPARNVNYAIGNAKVADGSVALAASPFPKSQIDYELQVLVHWWRTVGKSLVSPDLANFVVECTWHYRWTKYSECHGCVLLSSYLVCCAVMCLKFRFHANKFEVRT